MALLSLTESMVMAAVGDFITAYLPAGVTVVQGQDNQVAEPATDAAGQLNPKLADFVTMWPTLRERLETNTDSYSDITLEGVIAGDVLAVSSIDGGTLAVGQFVFGVGVTSGTLITTQTGGAPGGIGTYTVNHAQTIGPQALAAGLVNLLSPMKITIQLDVHGPNSTDNTQILVAVFRDEVGADFFEGASAGQIAPLYIDDGKQVPFVNGEKQYEDRWVLEAKLQINPVVSTPMQFADTLTIGIKEVDTYYPPGGSP